MANALTLKTFKELLKDPYNCLVSVQETRQLTFPSRHINDVDTGIRCLLDVDLKRYSRKLEGIVLAYYNVKILHDMANVVMDLPVILLDISVNLIVFRPRIGDTLRGHVNKVSRDHIGCIVINNYNASLLKPYDEEWDSQEVRIGDIVLFEVTHLYPQGKVMFIKGKLLEVEKKSDNHVNINADDDGYASALQSVGSLSPMENVITSKAIKKLEASGHGLGRKTYFADGETNEEDTADSSQTENVVNITATEMISRRSELDGTDNKRSGKMKKKSKSKTEEPLSTSVDVVDFDVTERESHKTEDVKDVDDCGVEHFGKQERKRRRKFKSKSESLSLTENSSEVVKHRDKAAKNRLGRKGKCGVDAETNENKTTGASQMPSNYSEDDDDTERKRSIKVKKKSKREKLLSTSVDLKDSDATERESHQAEGVDEVQVEIIKTNTRYDFSHGQLTREHSGNHHERKRKRKSKNNSDLLSPASNLNSSDGDNADRKRSGKLKKKRKMEKSLSTPVDLLNFDTTEHVSHKTEEMKCAHRSKVKAIQVESTSPGTVAIDDSANHKSKHNGKSEKSTKSMGEMSSVNNKDVTKPASFAKKSSKSKKRKISDLEMVLQTKSVDTTNNESQMPILDRNAMLFEVISSEMLDEFEVNSSELKKTGSKAKKHSQNIKRKGTEPEVMDKPTASSKFKKRKIGHKGVPLTKININVSKGSKLRMDNGKHNDSAESSDNLASIVDENSELFERMISEMVSECEINSTAFKKGKKSDSKEKKNSRGTKRKCIDTEFVDKPTTSLNSKKRKIGNENVLQAKGTHTSVSKGNKLRTPTGNHKSTIRSEDLTSILDENSELFERMVSEVLNESEINSNGLKAYKKTDSKAEKKRRKPKEKVEYGSKSWSKKVKGSKDKTKKKKPASDENDRRDSRLKPKEKHVIGKREDCERRKQEKANDGESEKRKTKDDKLKKQKKADNKLKTRNKTDDELEKQSKEKAKGDMKKQRAKNVELKKQKKTDGELKKQKTKDGELKKQKTKDGELKKQKTKDGELKKQKTKDGELKKQKTKVGELKRKKRKKKGRAGEKKKKKRDREKKKKN